MTPGYGSGPPATTSSNPAAEHRQLRKSLAANGMRSNVCDAAARQPSSACPRCSLLPLPCRERAPPVPPRSTSNRRLVVLRGGPGEAPARLRPNQREWARGLAIGHRSLVLKCVNAALMVPPCAGLRGLLIFQIGRSKNRTPLWSERRRSRLESGQDCAPRPC